MSNLKHTPEPWGKHLQYWNNNGGGVLVKLSLDDYMRATACVNACAGISNEELAEVSKYFGNDGRTYYTLVSDMREAQKQRDELLAALEKIASAWQTGNMKGLCQIAKTAIAQVKGGQS